MEISSVRVTGIQVYAQHAKNNAADKTESDGVSTTPDKVILSSGSVKTITYTSAENTSGDTSENTASTSGNTAANTTESTSETDGTTKTDWRTTYQEIIRDRVKYLFSQLFGEKKDATTSILSSFGYTAEDQSSSEDSYYSAEATASRIVDFALSFYNGQDRGEYADMVKSAVQKGYNQAAKAFGGDLPSVADKTISLVMSAIDQFAAGETA